MMGGDYMPVFVFLVFLGGILLWLLLSFAFVPLGKLAKRLWTDAKEAMNDYEKETVNETNEREES